MLRVLARCSCSPCLFPLFWTVIQHGCWVRLLSGSLTLCGWGSSPLLSAEAHARVGCLPVSVCILHSFCRSRIARGILIFHLSGPCSRGCRAAWADAPSRGCSGISRLSTVWPLPVLLRAGRERAVPCWGRCGFRAWWRRGVGDDGMPRDCARCECGHGVSLCLRVVLFAGGCAPCLVHGVWLRVLFLVGCFAALVAVCPLGCLFVGCVLLCRVLPVCCVLVCLTAIACCAFRERSRTWCDIVHAGLCGCAFDGDRGCRLLFTL